MRQRKKVRVIKHTIVSREDPTIILGHDPKDFPKLRASCAAAVKSWETGQVYRVAK